MELRGYPERLAWSTRPAYHQTAMAAQKLMLTDFPWDERYRVSGLDDVMTPALIVYPEIVASNVDRTLALLDGDPSRWRAHIKTAKLGYTLEMLMNRGIRSFKCATTLELKTACERGSEDVLLAYPVMGANARRAVEIAEEFPAVKVSALAENDAQVHQYRESPVSIFIDINPGMNRTGIEVKEKDKVLALIREIGRARLAFRGLHYYDGQFGGLAESERTTAAHAGYDQLLQLVSDLQRSGVNVPEIITAGTPTFPCSLSYSGFRGNAFVHRVSPGTIVYCDATCLAQLSSDYGYAPAVIVVARVVSHPRSGMITCDAGHKTVSADAGLPTCVVVGHPELHPQSPSEEHLPMQTAEDHRVSVGETLFLIPRHVCPTVNNFDSALLVRNGRIESIEKVTARGREGPLLPAPVRSEATSTR